jgi:TonB family protein
MNTKPLLLPTLLTLLALGLALSPARGSCDETRLDVHAPAGIEGLQDWDLVVQGIVKAAQELHGFDALLGPDVGGRTIGQYVDQWIMTSEVRAQLATLEQQASQQQSAGDAAGLAQTLAEANRIAQVQIYRATVLGNYGVARDGMREHMARINALVQRLPDGERVGVLPSLDGPAQLLLAGVISDLQLAEPPVEYADDSLRRYEQLGVDPLNAERVRIAWLVSDSERARGLPAKGRDRQSPCPATDGKSSGTDRPSIDRSSLSPLPYPADSQQKTFAGKVELQFHVAATGCVTRIDVYHSVGIDELDEAALGWGESVRYRPAEKDGQPIESTQVVSVTFKLAD